MTGRQSTIAIVALSMPLIGLLGCDSSKPLPPPDDLGSAESVDPYAMYNESFQFSDEVESNREDNGLVSQLEFTGSDGSKVRVDDYVGKKNVLLVFTRGFSGQLCPFCTTQTSRLIANYDKFVERDTEVLLVYPGQKDQLGEFRQASLDQSAKESFPFPVLLDEDLAVVKKLDIASHLAFPSTFVIDKQGRVTLSYVGSNPADRPSIKALLAQLDEAQS